MDCGPTAEQEELRQELRAWLGANLPWEYGVGLPPRSTDLAKQVEIGRSWQAKLARAGWVGITWPVEHGGRGLGPAAAFTVNEELARARAPELVGRIGVNLVGPTLLAHGDAAQKAKWLPHILDATELWCQLFSEPEAGSDLAAVRTSATWDAPTASWRLEGIKVWTSYAQFADWGLCLARTGDERHRGLTVFAVDMSAPGVEVHPLVQITGDAEFNQVVLNSVTVPDGHRIGAVGHGWQVAGSTLSHERGVNPRQLVIHIEHLEELLDLARRRGCFADTRLANRLAQAYTEVRLFELHNWRTLTRLEREEEPGPESSILKVYWSEMSKRLHCLALDVLGPDAAFTTGEGGGEWQRAWLYYEASSIFAGTNEIQRNVIAERVLGLPREPTG